MEHLDFKKIDQIIKISPELKEALLESKEVVATLGKEMSSLLLKSDIILHALFNKANPDLDVTDILLAATPNITSQDDQGKTPAHILIANQSIALEQKLSILEKLAKYPPDLNIQDNQQHTVEELIYETCPLGMSFFMQDELT